MDGLCASGMGAGSAVASARTGKQLIAMFAVVAVVAAAATGDESPLVADAIAMQRVKRGRARRSLARRAVTLRKLMMQRTMRMIHLPSLLLLMAVSKCESDVAVVVVVVVAVVAGLVAASE